MPQAQYPCGFRIHLPVKLPTLSNEDPILKGATPAELAVERMENIKLVVNAKTAKALGIKLPESILVRADEVIR